MNLVFRAVLTLTLITSVVTGAEAYWVFNSLDNLQGSADTLDKKKCKDCEEKEKHIYECAHWNAPIDPKSECKYPNNCIDNIFYYAACTKIEGSDTPDCKMTMKDKAVRWKQLVYETKEKLKDCKDPGKFVPMEGLPEDKVCQYPNVSGKTGKCFRA